MDWLLGSLRERKRVKEAYLCIIVDAAKRSEQRPLIGGTIKAFRDIVANEGVFRGLYRGVTPNIAGATASWGFYFWWYETLSIFLWKRDNDLMYLA